MSNSTTMKALRVLGCAATLALWAGSARAGGFALIEQSVSGLGNAFAGGAAAAEDATTIFFNPAGLTRLKGQHAIAGLHVVMPRAQFDNEGSKDVTGKPLTGGDGGQAGETGLVPNGYYSVGLDNGLAFGLGLCAPFGLATKYDSTWVGRYHAVESSVQTVNINPSVAYRVTPQWSLGAGLSAQWLDAKLTNKVDFGLAVTTKVAPGIMAPQGADADAELTGNDWGYGFNLGMLYEFNSNSRIGISYRSRIKHKIEGEADFTLPALPTGLPPAADAGVKAVAAAFQDTDADVEITLPDSASLSLYHRFNPKLAVMADITWTNWSTFDELRVKFDSGLADSVTTEDWKDTWRFSVGATYNPNPAWALRAGLAYDQEPIPDPSSRTPRIPGNDRLWTAVGVGYQIASWLGVDVGYAHLFVKDPEIQKSASNPEDASRGSLVGTYDASVDIVSAQLRAVF